MTERSLTKEQKTALGLMMIDAFRSGDLSIVEGCLRQGADLSHSLEWYSSGGSYYGNRPVLHWAAYFSRDKKILAAVIAAAPNIEVRATNGNNVLFAAIEANNALAAAMFTEAGADVLAQNGNKEVALEQARRISDAGTRKAVVDALLADYFNHPGPQPVKKEEPPLVVQPPPKDKKNPGNGFHL